MNTKELSKKYNIKLNLVRDYLRNKFDDFFYKQIRIITGKNLSKSIKIKMQDEDYRDKWVEKAKQASKLGNDKAKELLENDRNFKETWIQNCKKGGDKSFRTQRGFHDPNNLNRRLLGSIKGIKKQEERLLDQMAKRYIIYMKLKWQNLFSSFFRLMFMKKYFIPLMEIDISLVTFFWMEINHL